MMQKNERAIVLGGGYSGLLAAKVLSDHFKEVVIIERDSKSAFELTTPRKGAPQGGYAHFLMPMGINALEKLLPGFANALVANGAKKCDLCEDTRLINMGICMPRFNAEHTIYLMGRPLIDKVIWDFLSKCSNIVYQFDTEVKGLLSNHLEKVITGVRIQNKILHQESYLNGNLIVDATGHSSQSSKWLEDMGFKKPPIEEVEMSYNQLAYRARWREDFKPDWMYSVYRNAGLRKGGYFMNIEDDKEGNPQWLFAVVTHFGEPLEKKAEDFEKLCSQLENNAFSEAVKNATPLTEIGQYRVPKTRRKFFSQIAPLPSGFIAMGDAQCIWPPHTGLGLVFGALEGLVLQDVLIEGVSLDTPKNYFKKSEKLIAALWKKNITQEIIPYSGLSRPSLYIRLLGWYKMKLFKFSVQDLKLWKEMLPFVFNETTVLSLFQPSIVLRFLRHMIRGK